MEVGTAKQRCLQGNRRASLAVLLWSGSTTVIGYHVYGSVAVLPLLLVYYFEKKETAKTDPSIL